jgi:quinol monooxygenase YgiN
MFGLIGKMTSTPGHRDELITILLDGSQHMPGCLSYIVAKDSDDHDSIWVTEVWETRESHQASLTLPSVRSAIARAMPLIANFHPSVETEPVRGVGIPDR